MEEARANLAQLKHALENQQRILISPHSDSSTRQMIEIIKREIARVQFQLNQPETLYRQQIAVHRSVSSYVTPFQTPIPKPVCLF